MNAHVHLCLTQASFTPNMERRLRKDASCNTKDASLCNWPGRRHLFLTAYSHSFPQSTAAPFVSVLFSTWAALDSLTIFHAVLSKPIESLRTLGSATAPDKDFGPCLAPSETVTRNFFPLLAILSLSHPPFTVIFTLLQPCAGRALSWKPLDKQRKELLLAFSSTSLPPSKACQISCKSSASLKLPHSPRLSWKKNNGP